MPHPAPLPAAPVSPRPPLPSKVRFVRAASLALAGAVVGQGEDGLADVSDLHELAELLRAVLYDEGVMPA